MPLWLGRTVPRSTTRAPSAIVCFSSGASKPSLAMRPLPAGLRSACTLALSPSPTSTKTIFLPSARRESTTPSASASSASASVAEAADITAPLEKRRTAGSRFDQPRRRTA